MRIAMILALAVIGSALPPPTQAAMLLGHGCRRSHGDECGDCGSCAPCQWQTVTRTVLVPTWVTEMRTVRSIECRTEQRSRTVTVYQQVPERRQVEQQVVDYVLETRTRTEQFVVCRPVTREQTVRYTVLVPHEEVRRGVRQECRQVPYTQVRTVCEDHGCWVTQCCDTGGCGCRACRRRCCRQVWQPKIVERQVKVRCYRTEVVEVPVEVRVSVCRPETRTQTIQVCELVPETRRRQVQYQVCVPRVRTQTIDVVAYRCVPVEQTETYSVVVPHTVERQVPVQVCRMVPKQVTCRVPVDCCPCD